MRIFMHQADIRRNVSIMALAAVDLAAGETEMLRFEIFVITVVAIQALIGDRFRQQTGDRARVGQVAAETLTITGGWVGVVVIEPLGQVGVAGQAEPSSLIQQQVLNLARVRLVATVALTFGHRLVAADGRGQVAADFMAVGTDDIEPVDQKVLMVGGVMLVAAVTGLLLKRRVYDRVVCLRERFVAGQTQGVAVVFQEARLGRGVWGVAAVALADFHRSVDVLFLRPFRRTVMAGSTEIVAVSDGQRLEIGAVG